MEQLTMVDTFIDVILEKLKEKQSFSFVRFGDGEAILLDEHNDNLLWMLKRQLGYEPDDLNINILRSNLIFAYNDADMIGIPQQRHLNRDDSTWSVSLEILKSKLPLKSFNNKLFTSIDIIYESLNQSALANMNVLFRNSFNELLKDREKLNYISCRNLDNELKNKFGIKKINSYIIAPEMKFTPDYDGKKHYPDQFNEMYNWIKNVTEKGDLCLVGAGVIGKIYNSWFAQCGGISLDFGAVFDLWAGRNTRGPERGANVIIDTFKI